MEYEKIVDTHKNPRFTIRMSASLHEWFKAYAKRMNTSMSMLVIGYIQELQQTKASPSDASYEPKHTAYEQQLERADSEVQHLREQLTEKDNQLARRDEQIDHFQQIAAMSQKNIGALTEQLDDSRQLIEDMRHRRTVWQRVKAVFVPASS